MSVMTGSRWNSLHPDPKRVLWLLPCFALALTCRGAVDSDLVSQRVLVGGGESGRFLLLDGSEGKVAIVSEPGPQYSDAFAFSPDSGTLYFTAFGEGGASSKEVIALDTRSLQVIWRERLNDIAGRSTIGEVRVWGTYTLGVSSDGRTLVVDGARGDTVGLVVIDIQARAPVGFAGPLASGWQVAASIPADMNSGSGTLLLGGTRHMSDDLKTGYLFMLDGATFEILDSFPITQTVEERGGIRQLLPSPDGRYLYVVALDSLYQFDRVERRIAARAARPVPYPGARLAIAPDGQTLYMTDPGDGRDTPGSGRLFVLGPDLARRDPVDLRSAANIVVTHSAAVSLDGTSIYVTSGTASVGPLYGFAPSRLLIVDRRALNLLRSVELDDWGVRQVFVY